jgi:hypothetical protein
MGAYSKNVAVSAVLMVMGLGFCASLSFAQTAAKTVAQPATKAATDTTKAATAITYRALRTADGKPDLSGIWQAMNTAEWDIQAHDAKPGPLVVMGAEGGIPAGLGVVEDGPLPYRPEALAKKKENEANWLALDPVVKCFLPGLPRATYMGFPFEIVQSAQFLEFAYEFDFASRVVNIGMKSKAPVDSWMGWSSGSWDGDTLVVDVSGMVEDTWFDRAGDYHSDELHLTERYTPTGPNSLLYEVTVDDPKIYTRPWKMRMPLYRRLDKNIQLLEYNCVPFVEELMYGHLRKVQTPEELEKDNAPIEDPGGKYSPRNTLE